MSYLIETCVANTGNTGQQRCVGTPGRDERIWLVPPGTTIATKTLAETEATWDTLFNASSSSRGKPLNTIFNAEFEPSEDVYEEGWGNKQDFVKEGLDKNIYSLDKMSLYNSSKMRTLNGILWSAYIVTDTGNIKGWSDDGVLFKPFTMFSFRVGKRNPETGEAIERVPVAIVWAEPREWNDYPAIIRPAWNALELDGIKDIMVTASSPTGTGVNLTLQGYDSVLHENAVLADFVIYDSTSTPVAITAAPETSPGVYALAAVMAPGDYTAGLLDQPNAETLYVETPVLAQFTVT